MKKFIIVLTSIFEFVFYTFFMVLIDGINITSKAMDLLVHFLGLLVVALLFYFLIRFLFHKLDMKAKKYIYYLAIVNLVVTLLAPVLLIFIIPNETLTTLSFLILVSAVYYGIFINIVLCFLNYFFTNRYKKS